MATNVRLIILIFRFVKRTNEFLTVFFVCVKMQYGSFPPLPHLLQEQMPKQQRICFVCFCGKPVIIHTFCRCHPCIPVTFMNVNGFYSQWRCSFYILSNSFTTVNVSSFIVINFYSGFSAGLFFFSLQCPALHLFKLHRQQRLSCCMRLHFYFPP